MLFWIVVGSFIVGMIFGVVIGLTTNVWHKIKVVHKDIKNVKYN